MDHVEIARDLVIAAKTVEKHIEHILLKLGVHSRAQAIALALQENAEIGAGAEITRLEDVKRRDVVGG
jgi:hypothetical protein